jgi:hypothetical protein
VPAACAAAEAPSQLPEVDVQLPKVNALGPGSLGSRECQRAPLLAVHAGRLIQLAVAVFSLSNGAAIGHRPLIASIIATDSTGHGGAAAREQRKLGLWAVEQRRNHEDLAISKAPRGQGTPSPQITAETNRTPSNAGNSRLQRQRQ